MKHCPQCGAEYDDYVQYCFVDGAELVAGASGGGSPRPGPVRQGTPVPAPATHGGPAPLGGHPPAGAEFSHGARPSGAHGARPSKSNPGYAGSAGPRPAPPPEPSRSSPVWAVLVLLLLGVALLAFGGVVVALLFFSRQPNPPAATPAPIVAPGPTPAPTRPPPPLPSPAQPAEPTASVKVRFESTPPGATVFEGDTQLCVTPCEIAHPEIAPPTRQFVLRRDGFTETPHTMADLGVQRVTLKPLAAKPPPKPRGPDADDILPTR